jgi:hypothetical protein
MRFGSPCLGRGEYRKGGGVQQVMRSYGFVHEFAMMLRSFNF